MKRMLGQQTDLALLGLGLDLLGPLVSAHVDGNCSSHFASLFILTEVVNKVSFGVNQVHDDCMVHLKRRMS